MLPPSRIHIVGASGSGTTSLGVTMAAPFGHRHLDTDELVVFLVAPTPVRLARLRARESTPYGQRRDRAGRRTPRRAWSTRSIDEQLAAIEAWPSRTSRS